jgi:plastocyanin
MRRSVLTVIATCGMVVLLSAAGCGPPPVKVSVGDDFYSPASTSAARGATVTWANGGNLRHTTTGDAPLNLWRGDLPSGSNFSTKLVAGGSYTYHCEVHFTMHGTVEVPIAVSPTSGSTSTTFTVTLASTGAPSGFRYVVEKKDPGGSFAAFRTVTTPTTTFTASKSGTYQFRSELQRISPAGTSGFSDPVSVTVS